MILLVAALVSLVSAAALGALVSAVVYRRRLDAEEERADAALGDADQLAELLRGLQASLELGIPVTAGDISTSMPRTEDLVLAAAERDFHSHRPLPLRTRLMIRRAERAASRT